MRTYNTSLASELVQQYEGKSKLPELNRAMRRNRGREGEVLDSLCLKYSKQTPPAMLLAMEQEGSSGPIPKSRKTRLVAHEDIHNLPTTMGKKKKVKAYEASQWTRGVPGDGSGAGHGVTTIQSQSLLQTAKEMDDYFGHASPCREFDSFAFLTETGFETADTQSREEQIAAQFSNANFSLDDDDDYDDEPVAKKASGRELADRMFDAFLGGLRDKDTHGREPGTDVLIDQIRRLIGQSPKYLLQVLLIGCAINRYTHPLTLPLSHPLTHPLTLTTGEEAGVTSTAGEGLQWLVRITLRCAYWEYGTDEIPDQER
jgi:hypothetical protein